MLPDWVPNVHPLIVHFPIAFLLLGVVVDLLTLFFRRWSWGPNAATGLYLFAGASAVLTYFTGQWAADAVFLPEEVEPLLQEHAQFGWWTMLFAAIYALVRLGLAFMPAAQERLGIRIPLILIAGGGAFLVWQTAIHGAEMVYAHGIGVRPVEIAAQAKNEDAPPPDSVLGFRVSENGWQWIPNSPGGWKDRVEWVDGSPPLVQAYLFEPEGSGQEGLAIHLESETVLFTVPEQLGSVEIAIELNLDGFTGSVRIVHHVRGAKFYDFLELRDNRVRLGRREGSAERITDTGEYALQGWRTYRLVAGRARAQAFIGDRMVAAGQDTPASPGTVGLRLEGTGTVRLRAMQVRALREET